MTNPRDIRCRRKFAGVRSLLSVLFLAACLVAVLLLSEHLYVRQRFEGADVSFSPAVRSVLRTASGQLKAVLLLEEGHALRASALQYFGAMEARAPELGSLRVSVRAIDPVADLAEATAFLREHPACAPGSLFLSFGGRELCLDEFDLQSAFGADASAGNGGDVLGAALRKLTRDRVATVRFVSGHGEYDPFSRQPVTGGSAFAHDLTAAGYAVESFVLPDEGSLLDVDGALVIAGPRTDFTEREVALVARYLEDGGRVLLLVDDGAFANGFAGLLRRWGVRISRAPDGLRGPCSTLAYGAHPITASMAGVRSIWSPSCRMDVGSSGSGEGANEAPALVWPLVYAGPGRRVSSPDEPGAFLVAVAAERLRAEGDGSAARLVICADSGVLSNGMRDLDPQGGAFLLEAMDWLCR